MGVGNDTPGVVQRAPEQTVDGEGRAEASQDDTLTTGMAEVIDLDGFRRVPSQISADQFQISAGQEPSELDQFVVDLRSGDPVIQLPGTRRPQPVDLEPGRGLLAISRFGAIAKRLVDIFGSGLALALLTPIFLTVAAAIKLTSRGPVFYVSTRVGKDSKDFRFFKFRTMRISAESDKESLLEKNEVSGPVFKIKDDPRITKVGRVLRKLSIDELPQFIHVLKGQMSLVGPRPPTPDEVVRYSDRELQRLLVKPGMTCTWQVSGRSDIGFERWVEMDLQYIEGWSLGLDLRLMAATIPAVLSTKGAY
jgi:lipopolysaccharide/colanic/teichoic acid biosynthesis glycosyltransferase